MNIRKPGTGGARDVGVGLLTVLAVAAVGIPVAGATGPSPATAPARSTGVVSAAQASTLATSTGRRVEVLAERGERQQVFARPGGGFTVEQSTEVQRVAEGDRWVDVDTTLRARPDGTIRPVAAGVDLVLSHGGSSPLVTVRDAGASVSLTFPAPLPAPVLSGDTATYPEVLPGVDLEVRAHAESFSEVLVVKTPQAAQQQALKTLRFATTSSGGHLAAQPDGGFALVNDAGQVVLDSPQPRMWDSDSTDTLPGAAADPTPPNSGERISDETGATADQHAPAEGDRVAPLATKLTTTAVELTPPPAMLADPALTFPLYIDPSVLGGRQRWVMVNKTYPTTAYDRWADADQGVGYNSYSGINVKRLFWQFDTSQFQGARVSAARFTAHETFAATCTGSATSLWLTGPLPATTTWNQQPALTGRLDTQVLAAGRPDCIPAGTDVTWNATGGAQAAAASNAPITLGLLADNETTNDSWKRFTNDAKFSVDYDFPPAAPQLADLGATAVPCQTGPTRPFIGGSIALRAVLSDPDVGDQLTGLFVLTRTSTGTQTNYATGVVANHGTASRQLTGLADGVYSWKVQAVDAAGVAGGFSPSCEFEVDTTAPTAAPAVSSAEYPQDADGGGIGRQGWFVLASAGVTDVSQYAYAFDGTAERFYPSPVPGGTAAVPFSPAAPGPHRLLVTSLDRAGNRGPTTTYNFFTRSPTGPNGQWEFNTGPPARDDVSRNDAAFTGGAGAVALVPSDRLDADGQPINNGNSDQVLRLSGSGSCAITPAPGLQTADSFTVAAQVKINGLAVGADGGPTGSAGTQQVLSQDGAGDSALSLAYDGSRSAFVLSVRTPTGSVTAVTTAIATGQQVDYSARYSNGWISLIGVYDSASGSIRLYVNGSQLASATTTRPVPATGSFRIGCGQVRPEPLAGQVDDVRTWTVPLSQAMVSQVATEAVPSAGIVTAPATGRLESGASLATGSHLPSPDRSRDLWMKSDGNVVLTGPAGAGWTSNTASPTNAGSALTVDPGGSIVLVTPDNRRLVLLAGGTAGSAAVLTDNGDLELRRPDGGLAASTARPSALTTGAALAPGQDLRSANGLRRLLVDPTGDLVLLGPAGARWHSGTGSSANANSTLTVSAAGNLVLTAPDGRVTFTAAGQAGASLVLRDSGDLELTAGGLALWGAGTLPAGTTGCAPGSCLFGVRSSGTPSGRVEVHGAARGYTSLQTDAATAFPAAVPADWRFFLAPYGGSGKPDLFGVHLRGTGSGKVEVHVLSAASGYNTFTAHVATAQPALAPGAPLQIALTGYAGDRQPDLYFIPWAATGSGRVEVHVLSATSGYQTWVAHAATALPTSQVVATEWQFLVGDRTGAGDLVAVHHSGTASGKTEAHVLSQASGYQTWTLHVATPQGPTDDGTATWTLGDADGDTTPDLVMLMTGPTATGSTELHALSCPGDANTTCFGNWAVQTRTALPEGTTAPWQLSLG